jgi:hypothetical protein
MRKKIQKDSMICPCCGEVRGITSIECTSCGARQIGEPMAKPDVLLPKLGSSFAAASCVLLLVITFLAIWLFGNDMKVGRVLLVWALGDGTKFTQELLQINPKLPYYKIFSYDAYRQIFFQGFIWIPLAMLGVWLGRRALQRAKNAPEEYGGLKLARVSTVASTFLLALFSVGVISHIPDALERSRLKQAAATRAAMYALHAEALEKYHREYGSYPQELSDVSRVNAEAVPHTDYWENNFTYQPTGVIASRGSAISFSNYKLVSAGPDGKFDTEDDISMEDGIILQDGQTKIEKAPTSSKSIKR